ncbi:hypothetical protein [Burkholderia sp. AU38729]|uniref:amidohydrolase family protein n=1 Tax=Burkholderia sp. AU38729 TaxID=2879633 RepID=UPI001CF50184|nr:hypothetical protein [Burkholderia sp. AU38729]MCA8060806.1 hypothetical protein [Burkholderia sp. AU38729]
MLPRDAGKTACPPARYGWTRRPRSRFLTLDLGKRGIRLFSAADNPEWGAVIDDVWAISNVLYFDTEHRALQRADIEICDNEIVAITPPTTSSVPTRMNGHGLVCTPGLVNGCLVDGDGTSEAASGVERAARLGDALRQAVMRGVTTVGVFSRRAEADIALITKAGVRASLYREYMDIWLGPEPRAVEHDVAACLRDYDKLMRRFDGALLAIQPAVGSQLAASTQLLTGLHEAAKKRNGRFVIRVDGGAPWAESFRDAYGCSGLALLRSLDVVDAHTLIVPTAQMSPLERSHLRKCHTNVVHDIQELDGRPGRRGEIARTDITGRPRASLHWGAGPLPGPGDLAPARDDDRAGDVIDVLTWKGAQAVQFPETGRVAVGLRADLLLYDLRLLPGQASMRLACADVLDMLVRHAPQGVLVDGRWVVRAPALLTRGPGRRYADPLAFGRIGAEPARAFDALSAVGDASGAGELSDLDREHASRDVAL